MGGKSSHPDPHRLLIIGLPVTTATGSRSCDPLPESGADSGRDEDDGGCLSPKRGVSGAAWSPSPLSYQMMAFARTVSAGSDRRAHVHTFPEILCTHKHTRIHSQEQHGENESETHAD